MHRKLILGDDFNKFMKVGRKLRRVVGVDVSSKKSNYCMINNDGEKELEGVVKNNLEGIEQLVNIIEKYKAEVIFEPTGIYSQKLQFLLDINKINYVLINPLLAKKEMDTLRTNKNDKLDAKNLAILQMEKQFNYTVRDAVIYQELRWEHRFYQEIITDLVSAKNRLHRVLQMTFSEIELLYTVDTEKFYQIVQLIPHAHMIVDKKLEEVIDLLSIIYGKTPSLMKRSEKLLSLAKNTAVSVSVDSPLIEQVRYWASKVLELNNQKKKIINQMIEKASRLEEFKIISSVPGFGEVNTVGLIAELGNIRKFSKSQQMNAFIGIDLRFNDSGQYKSRGFITKRGNSTARKIVYLMSLSMIAAGKRCNSQNPISVWYEDRSKNETHGKKKIIIGAMDRTLRLIHHLVIKGELYNYR